MKTNKNDEVIDSMGAMFQEMCAKFNGAEASSRHLNRVINEWVSFAEKLQVEEEAVTALTHSLSSSFLPLIEEVVLLLHDVEYMLKGKVLR
ncbi:hypothetical protein LSM04_005919 [Trypanosoma melophagium]|uniref:uncharacterized protein n=1 Tax=Trypanosoma melophagium TaxID=715481 RepID=UPI00351A8607|nr:hypothetical protein LSM04_005919 [Trypanosoma melophagium]